MTDLVNRLAWLIAAMTILVWVFVPRIVWAYPVLFPRPASVESTMLPPAPPPPVVSPGRSR